MKIYLIIGKTSKLKDFNFSVPKSIEDEKPKKQTYTPLKYRNIIPKAEDKPVHRFIIVKSKDTEVKKSIR